jgi:hypothetical protein
MARLEDIIREGTRGAQPAANTVDVGTLYRVSDEAGKLERSDGASWQSTGGNTGLMDHVDLRDIGEQDTPAEGLRLYGVDGRMYVVRPDGYYEAAVTTDQRSALDSSPTPLTQNNPVASMADIGGAGATPTLAEVLAAGNMAPPGGGILAQPNSSVWLSANDESAIVGVDTNTKTVSANADVQITLSAPSLTLNGQPIGTQAANVEVPYQTWTTLEEARVAFARLVAAMRASGLMAQVPVYMDFGQQPTNAVVYVAPQNEIQRITGGGVISGGTWDITNILDGVVTGIPWDVDSEGLYSRLVGANAALTSVTGGPLASAPFDIEFIGGWGNQPWPELTVDATNLTGTDPTLTPSTVQDGRAEAGIISPAVTVRILDDMENVCTRDNTTVVRIIAGDTLPENINGAVATAVAGIATFNDLSFSVPVENDVLQGVIGPIELSFLGQYSDPFTIS